jgi:DNA-binding CsgD family transcriptional regulator/PAS domain-containing protein
MDLAFDAALDEALWPGFASSIAGIFGGNSTALRVRNTDLTAPRVISLTSNYSQIALDEYERHYWRHDLWVARGAAIGPGRVLTSEQVVEDREMERSEWAEWCHRRLNVRHMVGAVVPLSSDAIGVIGVHRSAQQGAFGETERKLLSAFLPHLRRALLVYHRLNALGIERQAAIETANRTAMAVIVADAEGRVLSANPAAERLLRQGGGLRAVAGRLAAAEGTASERLRRLIRGAAEAAAGRGLSSGGALLLSRAGRLPLSVLVAPLRPTRDGFGAGTPAAILFVRCLESCRPDTASLQQLFGLTAAEAAMVVRLADGASIDEIASRAGITLNTARTHLKSAMAKTETRRQAEMVALVLRSVATFGTT